MVIVAQLVRALVCGAGGRGFESHQLPIFKALILYQGFFYSFFCKMKSNLQDNLFTEYLASRWYK